MQRWSNATALKRQKLYRAIDSSNFYRCPVVERDRSLMNVTFTLADESLDNAFVKGAEAARDADVERASQRRWHARKPL